MFEEEVRHLEAAKQGVYKGLNDGSVTLSPTVAEATRTFSMFLDSAYLWLCQLKHFAAAGGTAEVPEGVEVKFPGGQDGGS